MAAPRGFSLIEVLVALVILGVLAAVAMPSYADYVARGRRLEARAALLEAAHWLERWRTERGRYDDPANADQPPSAFPWRRVPAGGRPTYSISVVVSPTRYTITATPINVMAGDVCESLSIDQTGLRAFTGARATEDICWNR